MRLARAAVEGQVRYGDADGDLFHEVQGDVFVEPRRTGRSWPMSAVSLVAPIDPGRILFIMGGFLAPDADAVAPGTVPWFLPKAVHTVSGPGGVVLASDDINGFWVEPELGVVIGREIHDVTVAEAADAIFGYTCFNDITAPQYLFDDVPSLRFAATLDILRAKCQDTFAIMGPWITTDLTEDDVTAGLTITGRVNGEVIGQGNTRRSKFSPREWVRFAASATTLRPGDVLALGTPCPCDAVVGDEFEIEVEGIGRLAGRIAPKV